METSDIKFKWKNSWVNGVSDTDRNWTGMVKLLHRGRRLYDTLDEGSTWEWKVRIKGERPITVAMYRYDLDFPDDKDEIKELYEEIKDGSHDHNREIVEEKTSNSNNSNFEIHMKDVTEDDEGIYMMEISNYNSTVMEVRGLVVE